MLVGVIVCIWLLASIAASLALALFFTAQECASLKATIAGLCDVVNEKGATDGSLHR